MNAAEPHADAADGAHVEQAPIAEAKATSEDAEDEDEPSKLKRAFTRNAAKVTPAVIAWARRAKVAAALLAARARKRTSAGSDVEVPVRRTTAPAPGGGLHTAGRKVVRGSIPDERLEEERQPNSRFKITKKKVAVGASIGVATVLMIIALRKPSPAPQLASAPPAPETTAEVTPVNTAPAAPAPAPVTPPMDPLAAAAQVMANGGPGVHAGKPAKPTPFTNGPVGAHPTVIKIKMDGPVEGIQGAAQPTGFTVVTPNRKAVDPTSSLASKDARLEGVRISNEDGGAEFNVTFKDGVPNYIVRARGDTLEMVLAKPSGPGKAEAHVKRPTKKSKKR